MPSPSPTTFQNETAEVAPVRGDLFDYTINQEYPTMVYDFGLEVSKGNVDGHHKVNKFGSALDCDASTPTDVWDGADGATSTDVWVAPTTARIHDLQSSSIADTLAGTGAQVVRVYGLTSWSAAEVSEDVDMNGTGTASTVNAYVIIYRMKVIQYGSGLTAAGTITATAQTDATVTAAILQGSNQTKMAILGVPDTQTFYMTYIVATALTGSGSNVRVDASLLATEDADAANPGEVVKEEFQFTEAIHFTHAYDPPKVFVGPCILKVQVVANSNNTPVTVSFDGYLVDNVI